MNTPITEPVGTASDLVVAPCDGPTKAPPSAKLDVTAYCTVYPDVMIRPFLYKGEDRVAIHFGQEDVTIVFPEVNDLWRLRGAVDEAVRLLTGQIAYLTQ